MGVILSGPKGVGKSMFARLLAEAGKKSNLPLLIVDTPAPGIEDFISSIHQECIVLFDEFEKTFKTDKDSDYSPQDNLLSLFDGIDDGKKLYIITCNDTRGLSPFLLNRPGRFHYHFMLSTPTGDEVREYMNDNLVGDARQYIDKIVAGEDAMKPDLESFELAIGDTPKDDCLMIGDSIKSDKVGAENAGIDCYIVDKEHNMRDLLQMVMNSKVWNACLVKKK